MQADRVEFEWERWGHAAWLELGAPEPPTCGSMLAAMLGIRVLRGRRDESPPLPSCIFPRRNTIYIEPESSEPQQAFTLFHEITHRLFPHVKEHRAINYLAACIALPREQAMAVFADTWDLWAFGALMGPHFSSQVLGRRLISLVPNAVMTIWHDRRCEAVLRYPALRTSKPSSYEIDLALELFLNPSFDRVDGDGRAHAIAEDTANGRWVVTIMDAEQRRDRVAAQVAASLVG